MKPRAGHQRFFVPVTPNLSLRLHWTWRTATILSRFLVLCLLLSAPPIYVRSSRVRIERASLPYSSKGKTKGGKAASNAVLGRSMRRAAVAGRRPAGQWRRGAGAELDCADGVVRGVMRALAEPRVYRVGVLSPRGLQ